MPRDGRNLINDGTTGLLASPPLGSVDIPQSGRRPTEGGVLESVLGRGELRCGVRGGRPGFAVYNSDISQWEGMDVEYCRTLATALFDGDAHKVTFKDVTGFDGVAMLAEGDLDVVAGITWTLQDDMNGLSFTQPYFYGPVGNSR